MSETKLKIMEMLDKEGLVDKRAKVGCLFLSDDGKIYTILANVGSNDCNFFTGHARVVEHSKKPQLKKKIIGQYHLGHILQWFRLKNCLEMLRTNKVFIYKTRGLSMYLDLKTPPMERPEKQDKELLAFMQKTK